MREPMGVVDASWFRMDRPENTADVVMLLTFRHLPPMPRVRRLIEDHLLACPRFRQRAIRGSAFGGDAWEDDPSFSLDHHLVRRRLRSGDQGALRALVSRIASERLDPARPPWRVYFVEGPSGGAVVVKIHHCVGDGFALTGLFLTMADEPAEVPTPSRRTIETFQRLEPWLDPIATLKRALREPRRALSLALEAGVLAAALARMTALPPDPPTILSRPLSGQRRAAWSRGLPLAHVREAARAHGATVNDIILAAVAGALRAHLAAAGEEVDGLSLRALMPVNLRPGPPEATSNSTGNRFGLVFLDLPTNLATPDARLEAVRERTALAKVRPDAIVAFGVLAALGCVPGIAQWATRFFSRKASVVITNVPGPTQRLHWGRHRVESAMFWVPHPGTLGLGISVNTYGGEVRIGVRADVAVMPDPGDLVARFEQELATLGAAPAHGRRRAS